MNSFYKRMMVLFAAVFAVGCSEQSLNSNNFENVYRAAKTIDAAISVGTNYPKFGELLANFATEISIMTDIADKDAKEEMELGKNFAEVFLVYKDSYTIWKQKIDSGNTWEGNVLYAYNDQPMPEMAVIVKKYALTVKPMKTTYSNAKVAVLDPDESIQKIWAFANREVTRKNSSTGR